MPLLDWLEEFFTNLATIRGALFVIFLVAYVLGIAKTESQTGKIMGGVLFVLTIVAAIFYSSDPVQLGLPSAFPPQCRPSDLACKICQTNAYGPWKCDYEGLPGPRLNLSRSNISLSFLCTESSWLISVGFEVNARNQISRFREVDIGEIFYKKDRFQNELDSDGRAISVVDGGSRAAINGLIKTLEETRNSEIIVRFLDGSPRSVFFGEVNYVASLLRSCAALSSG